MLKLEDVDARYGPVRVLFDVSLEVRRGEIVALIGANGAGKTTTLNIISGLLRPTAGVVMFEGENIARLKPDAILRRGIAHCPEGRQLWPSLTVMETLWVGAHIREDRSAIKRDVDRMFHYFPILKERRKQLAGTLSGGEAQMLAIARTLMARPRIILFDEPSQGLAPVMVDAVGRIVRMIREDEGIAVLLVEQNARLALDLSDRAYVLQAGRVVLEGSSKELLGREDIRTAYLGRVKSRKAQA